LAKSLVKSASKPLRVEDFSDLEAKVVNKEEDEDCSQGTNELAEETEDQPAQQVQQVKQVQVQQVKQVQATTTAPVVDLNPKKLKQKGGRPKLDFPVHEDLDETISNTKVWLQRVFKPDLSTKYDIAVFDFVRGTVEEKLIDNTMKMLSPGSNGT
jgi:hypothetical protein